MEVLYYNTIRNFIKDVNENSFINKMMTKSNDFYWRHQDEEIRSWKNNANNLATLLEEERINQDAVIAFECSIPGGGRVDCMLFGKGKDQKNNIIHIELKQWTNNSVSKEDNDPVLKEMQVEAFTGGATRIVSHPLQQVKNYHHHILNMVKLFDDPDYTLQGCAYCYNYSTGGDLYDESYRPLLNDFSLFSGDESDQLISYLTPLLSNGEGEMIFHAFNNSRIAPTKKLSQAVANMFQGNTPFHLLDEQENASFAIFNAIKKARNENQKSVIIVKGGPGTGKTLIAFHVLSQLAAENIYENCFFTTRSKALRTDSKLNLTDVKIENTTTNASDLVQNIYSFRPYNYNENELDVVLVDEAHRTCEKGNSMSDRNNEYTYLSQTLALLYCSKVVVFFIDDKQAIDNKEVGLSNNLIETARNYRDLLDSQYSDFLNVVEREREQLTTDQENLQSFMEEHPDYEDLSQNDKTRLKRLRDKVRITERDIRCSEHRIVSNYDGTIETQVFELTTQFRCNGSNNYIQWLDNTIYRSDDTTIYPLDRSKYEFDVFDTPQELYQKIVSLNAPEEKPEQIARISAGYCWTWTKKPLDNGDLAKDVVIGDFAMPWETNEGRPRGEFRNRYASSADTWIKENGGINQVGCIFSAQGFEVDYMGVIIGDDLDYDEINDKLIIDASKNKVSSAQDRHILNAYRILMTRGQKGTFVYCTKPRLREYFKRKMNETAK